MTVSAPGAFAAALSTAPTIESACAECAEALRDGLSGAPDVVLAFGQGADRSELATIPTLLGDALDPGTLVGCSAGGVLAGGREVEGRPDAVAVLGAKLPGAGVHAVHLSDADLPGPDAPPSAWVDRVGVAPEDTAGMLVLADPFRCDVQRLLGGLDYAWPAAPKVGGLASGGRQPESILLFDRRRAVSGGALVVAWTGALEMRAVVAQGCRALGRTGTITKCKGNVLHEIDGVSAFEYLHRQVEAADDETRERSRRAPVFLGVATDPFASDATDDGEFLVRSVLQHDRTTNALVIGDALRPGRRVRFLLRDRETSHEDVRAVLAAASGPPWQGALMFSCLGRGVGLYGEDDHDSRVFAETIGGDVPLAGFFCNGEIGPVTDPGATFVHGYTSSFALIRTRPGGSEA